MNSKAKAKMEKDMEKLRKQMEKLGKQLEKDYKIKNFNPLKNMNPNYPFNISSDNNTINNNPFGTKFPFNNNSNQKFERFNNPFGHRFPFNLSQQHNATHVRHQPPFEQPMFDNQNAKSDTGTAHTRTVDESTTPFNNNNAVSSKMKGQSRVCVIDDDYLCDPESNSQ